MLAIDRKGYELFLKWIRVMQNRLMGVASEESEENLKLYIYICLKVNGLAYKYMCLSTNYLKNHKNGL